MHLLLTDRLACPRCGPAFGLILLADRMADRRVKEGTLGCPNCRDSFPIHEGFGDLRAPPRRALGPGLAGAPRKADTAEVDRVAALLGVARGPGTIVLTGGLAALAPALAGRIEDVDVVGVDADLGAWPDTHDWSRLAAGPGLPFFSRALRGVGVDGRLGIELVPEAARVCAPTARVVVTHAPDQAADVLVEAGLRILAAEAGTIVAERS